MSSVEDKINKLREERMAREKARIEKLRELNLKKYNKPDSLVPKNFINKAPSTKSLPKTEQTTSGISKVKNMSHLNLTSKRPFTAPFPLAKKINKEVMLKPMTAVVKPNQSETKIAKIKPFCGDIKKIEGDNKSATIKPTTSKTNSETVKANTNVTLKPSGKESKMPRPIPNTRKSLAPPSTVRQALQPLTRKSMLPTSTINPKKPNANWESVFDRLYKPKTMQTNAEPIKKVLVRKSLKPIESKPKTLPIRRSISAVHFKKVNKSELKNCFHKWASIGDQLNDAHMNEIVEENGSNEQIVCAIKSERKKVKFSTSILQNTPKPEELQERLQKWLLKRGKSLESFHHLQCFGIHHLSKPIRPLQFEDARDLDEENKENQPVESDSDNESFTDNTNDRAGDFKDKSSFAADKWRRTSIANSSLAELNDTTTSTLSQSLSSAVQSDELLVGALTDLTELIKEGFDWNQCAHWLSAVRKRCPNAGSTAAYWECRAALEERRGNLPLSVHCWEEAIVNGTEQTVVEANLDHLLDKFMQLNISTNDKSKQVDPKLVDVKNVFKSTIIRFAVQQAKL